MLVAVAVSGRPGPAPECRVDLGDHGAARRRSPAIEGPEVDLFAQLAADPAQPGDAAVGRFRDAALHVEMKDRFGAAALLGDPPPTGAAGAGRGVPAKSVANEIDVGVILVRRPVPLEIVEKRVPFRQQEMFLEIAEGEGKRMIDPDQRRRTVAEFPDQPLRELAAGPILARARRRRDLDRFIDGRRRIDTEALQAAVRRLRTRVVDAEVTVERGHGEG